MPKHKQHDRPKTKELSFRTSLVEQVDSALVDPFTKKPAFAAWSDLTEALLEGWLEGKFKVHIEPRTISLKEFL